MTLIAAYLAFCTAAMNEITAFIAILLVVSFCLVFLRTRFLTVAVGLPALLGFLTYSSFIPMATIVAPLFAIAFGAASLLHAKKLLVILGWIVAGGCAALLTADVLSILPVVLWAICAAVLALCLAKGWRRTGAICTLSILLLLGLAGSCLLLAQTLAIDLTAESLSAVVDQIRQIMAEAFFENAAMLDENMRMLMTRELFDEAFDTMLVTLPAAILISVNLLAFFAHLLTLRVCNVSGYLEKLPEAARVFLLSPVTAVVYILSFVLMIAVPFVADDAAVLSLTAQNLTLVLTPALAFVGWLGIYGFLAKAPGCLNVWVLLGLGLVVFYSQGIALYAIAFLGVYLTFRANKRLKLNE